MTYNVQWFTGINSQLDMQEKIINKYHAHIIGLQELTTTGKINSIGRKALAGYEYQYLSKHKNFLGIASVYPLKNVQSHEFSCQDPEDMTRYGETRAYMTAEMEIGGKTITLINTHLCYMTQEDKFKQMRQIFRRAERSEYVIIMGDFNCFAEEMGDKEQTSMYQRFIDAGYQMADCSQDNKMIKTWTDKANPKYLSRLTYPTDNIITSGNIKIKKAMFDKTKLKWPDGNPMDHIPIVARLYIK